MAEEPAAKKAPRRRTARTEPTASAPSARHAVRDDAPTLKQAVVVVHGIGEQRPLDTLREFVDTAFQRDASLTPDDGDPRYAEMVDGFKRNRVWIVPDVTTGSNELRRITTTEHFGNRRTDFYEYYWADLTNGTPLEMVRAWVMGLLIRSPWRIPNDGRVWWAWIILWALSLLLVTFAVLIAYPTAGPFEHWMAALGRSLDAAREWLTIVLALLGVILLVVRAYRTKPIKRLKLKAPLGLFLLAAIVYFVPTSVLTEPRVWAAIGTAVIGYVTATVLVPYIGDIVQYVRATPATVKAREAIRTRGVELLRAVLDKNYDRVILVGHSLGCFVAYDLLQLIWQERGPSPKNGWSMSEPLKAALAKVDLHVEAWNPLDESKAPVFDAGAFEAAQAELREQLAASDPKRWVITDFVTLGSPIAHSAFLTHDDGDAVAAALRERMLSASPPRPDVPNNSMLYASTDGSSWPHHAAAFAAVRWTNIFDHAAFPVFGDVVSGAVDREQFGPGVRNRGVAIRRGTLPLWSRRFTHTEYWRLANGSWQAPDDHILKLREALNLKGT